MTSGGTEIEYTVYIICSRVRNNQLQVMERKLRDVGIQLESRVTLGTTKQNIGEHPSFMVIN